MDYGLVVGPGLQLTFTFQTLTQGFLEPEAMKGWEVGHGCRGGPRRLPEKLRHQLGPGDQGILLG